MGLKERPGSLPHFASLHAGYRLSKAAGREAHALGHVVVRLGQRHGVVDTQRAERRVADQAGADKAVARELLAAPAYDPGKAYEDFDAATDRVALYGIAALIGGVAAFFAGVWKLFGRRRADTRPLTPPSCRPRSAIRSEILTGLK
jgi:hypothetical protein